MGKSSLRLCIRIIESKASLGRFFFHIIDLSYERRLNGKSGLRDFFNLRPTERVTQDGGWIHESWEKSIPVSLLHRPGGPGTHWLYEGQFKCSTICELQPREPHSAIFEETRYSKVGRLPSSSQAASYLTSNSLSLGFKRAHCRGPSTASSLIR